MNKFIVKYEYYFLFIISLFSLNLKEKLSFSLIFFLIFLSSLHLFYGKFYLLVLGLIFFFWFFHQPHDIMLSVNLKVFFIINLGSLPSWIYSLTWFFFGYGTFALYFLDLVLLLTSLLLLKADYGKFLAGLGFFSLGFLILLGFSFYFLPLSSPYREIYLAFFSFFFCLGVVTLYRGHSFRGLSSTTLTPAILLSSVLLAGDNSDPDGSAPKEAIIAAAPHENAVKNIIDESASPDQARQNRILGLKGDKSRIWNEAIHLRYLLEQVKEGDRFFWTSDFCREENAFFFPPSSTAKLTKTGFYSVYASYSGIFYVKLWDERLLDSVWFRFVGNGENSRLFPLPEDLSQGIDLRLGDECYFRHWSRPDLINGIGYRQSLGDVAISRYPGVSEWVPLELKSYDGSLSVVLKKAQAAQAHYPGLIIQVHAKRFDNLYHLNPQTRELDLVSEDVKRSLTLQQPHFQVIFERTRTLAQPNTMLSYANSYGNALLRRILKLKF